MFKNLSITLASESPRRTQILDQLQIPHVVYAPQINEKCDINAPIKKVMYLAKQKALAVLDKVDTDIVIAADTIVAIPVNTTPREVSYTTSALTQYTILEKPNSLEHAATMLRLLSNKTHEVYTGLCVIDKQELINKNSHIQLDYSYTKVKFIAVSEILLQEYLRTKEWQGVAGAYRIQGLGALFIDSIIGNYSTVVGLPIPLLYSMLLQVNKAH